MLFSSYAFLFQFLPATVLAFAAARRHSPRAGIMVLAGASLFFYGAWRPVYLLLFIASIGINFGLGLRMEDPLRRRAIGTFGVALNLAVLCYFKYTNFVFDSLNMLTGAPLPFANIVLPLGVSVFTFQQIAYLVDVMRGAKIEGDVVSYTLFVSGFSHLAAGGAVTTPWAWLATLAYSLQIYFDFSGYSDMAIGLALLFGIRLPVNFRSPYKAASIIDFWRRWHITLSRFLRDYLYIPLGGNRLGEQRRYVNLLVTMLLGGLWQRGGWDFLVWGGLHGVYISLNHLWREWLGGAARASASGPAAKTAAVISWALTFFAVV